MSKSCALGVLGVEKVATEPKQNFSQRHSLEQIGREDGLLLDGMKTESTRETKCRVA